MSTKEIKMKAFSVKGDSKILIVGPHGVGLKVLGLALLHGIEWKEISVEDIDRSAMKEYLVTYTSDNEIFNLYINGVDYCYDKIKSRSNFTIELIKDSL